MSRECVPGAVAEFKGKRVTSEKEFSEVLEAVEAGALKFVEDGNEQPHYMVLVDRDGAVTVSSVDQFESLLGKVGLPEHVVRGVMRGALVEAMETVGARGFVQVCEAWTLEIDPETAKDVDKVVAFSDGLKEKYGSIAKVPGRSEILAVNAKWEGSPPARIAYRIREVGGARAIGERTLSSPGPTSDIDALSMFEEAIEGVYLKRKQRECN